jgi:pimeloyl-ACP methyl ester carboxylesterase
MKEISTLLLLLVLCTLLPMSITAQERADQTDQPKSDIDRVGATLEFLRQRNAQQYAVTNPNGIDEAKYITIGGIEQWITIRGEDRNNPVLLFLHGGPGDATNPWGYAGFRSWLRDFTVVQWDQRGAGRTLGKNGPSIAETITIDRMSRDGIELTEYLCKSLKKDRVILVGHSWGSILGIFMAKARPELFYAFVGTGQVANPLTSYTIAYQDLVRKAKSVGDQTAVSELTQVGPPPYRDGKGYAVQRKWANQFEHADIFLWSTLGLAMSAPGYTLRDTNDWLEGQGVSADRLVPVTSKLKPEELAGSFRLPVFVIQGAEDFTTPTSLARTFVTSIQAPRKTFVQIEGGHFAVFMNPDAFVQVLISRVLPLVHAVKANHSRKKKAA